MTASIATNPNAIPALHAETRAGVQKPYPWILHPVLDLALGCGGIVWLLFFFHYYIVMPSGAVPPELVAASALGVLIFAETHTASTILVAYRNADVRSQFAFYTKCFSTICLIVAAAGIAIPGVAPVLVKIYLLMVPHHFLAQTFGISMLYCMKRGYKLGKWERASLMLFLRCVTWYAVLRQLTYKEWSTDVFLMQPVPFWGPLPAWICESVQIAMLFSAIVLCGFVIVRTLKTGELLPIPAQLTILTGVSAFVLGPLATGIFWLYVSAYYHGTQYLMLVMAQRIKEHGLPEGMSTHKIARQLFSGLTLKFVIYLGLLSFTIYTAVPNILKFAGIEFATAIAALFTSIQFFHIITDGAIWKLRDPKVRAELVS